MEIDMAGGVSLVNMRLYRLRDGAVGQNAEDGDVKLARPRYRRAYLSGRSSSQLATAPSQLQYSQRLYRAPLK